MAEEFAEHLATDVEQDPEAFVFTSPRGFMLRHSNFRKTTWLPALQALNLPTVGIHALRHSAASRMIAEGVKVKGVQKVLGHSKASYTLDVYTHFFDTELDGVADALDKSLAAQPRPESEEGEGRPPLTAL